MFAYRSHIPYPNSMNQYAGWIVPTLDDRHRTLNAVAAQEAR